MIDFRQIRLLVCGLLLTLAAFPVFAQTVVEPQLNRKPLEDLADFVNEKAASEKVDLTKPFMIQLEGTLTKDGKLDPRKSKFTKSEGDAAMIEIGKNVVEAISDSGFFVYLQQMGIEKMNLTLLQDETSVRGTISSELPTPEKAKTVASGLNTMFLMARLLKEKNDEKVLIENWSFVSSAKNLSINFAAPRDDIHALIKTNLEKLAAKRQANR